MNETDTSIVQRSNIQCDVVVVSQGDKDAVIDECFTNKAGSQSHVKMICTTERGLSRSRNMALLASTADICLISDDDETFKDNCEKIITDAFIRNPKADIIAFVVDRKDKQYPAKPGKINYISSLRVSSVQIAFRRNRINEKGITFDVQMGSGTGHGAGEENKFLYDCLKKGLKIYYEPLTVAVLDDDCSSQWFSGYSSKYFENLGWSVQRYMGTFFSTLYAFYWCVKGYRLYCKECSFFTAIISMLRGIYVVKYD